MNSKAPLAQEEHFYGVRHTYMRLAVSMLGNLQQTLTYLKCKFTSSFKLQDGRRIQGDSTECCGFQQWQA